MPNSSQELNSQTSCTYKERDCVSTLQNNTGWKNNLCILFEKRARRTWLWLSENPNEFNRAVTNDIFPRCCIISLGTRSVKIIVRWHVAGYIRTMAAFIAEHASLRLARIVTVGDKSVACGHKICLHVFSKRWVVLANVCAKSSAGNIWLIDRSAFERLELAACSNFSSLYSPNFFKFTLCSTDWTINVFHFRWNPNFWYITFFRSNFSLYWEWFETFDGN